MLKLGCSLRNLANIRLHKSTATEFCPFTKTDEDLLKKNREALVGGPFFIFRRKAVVDETFIQKFTNICKSILGVDASQLYHYSMSQTMLTGLHSRCELDSDKNRFKTTLNKTRSLENVVMFYFRRIRPKSKNKSMQTEEIWLLQCWLILFSLLHCVWSHGLLSPLFSCQEVRPYLID